MCVITNYTQQVILTTVGPYGRYGNKLVAACASAGVHCCDLTGEDIWLRGVIDKHQEEAERTGAKIVSSCGFNSIPAVRPGSAGIPGEVGIVRML